MAMTALCLKWLVSLQYQDKDREAIREAIDRATAAYMPIGWIDRPEEVKDTIAAFEQQAAALYG